MLGAILAAAASDDDGGPFQIGTVTAYPAVSATATTPATTCTVTIDGAVTPVTAAVGTDPVVVGSRVIVTTIAKSVYIVKTIGSLSPIASFIAPGPYSTTLPGATTGTAVTLPGGVFRGTFQATAYTTAAGNLVVVALYVDGVLRTQSAAFANAGSTHLTLGAGNFAFPLGPGVHYFAAAQNAGAGSGISDANDRWAVSGTVTTT